MFLISRKQSNNNVCPLAPLSFSLPYPMLGNWKGGRNGVEKGGRKNTQQPKWLQGTVCRWELGLWGTLCSMVRTSGNYYVAWFPSVQLTLLIPWWETPRAILFILDSVILKCLLKSQAIQYNGKSSKCTGRFMVKSGGLPAAVQSLIPM